MVEALVTDFPRLLAHPIVPANSRQHAKGQDKVLAPFVSRPSWEISAAELKSVSLWQKYFAGSTATPVTLVVNVIPPESGAEAIHEIRRLSGLTWEQVSGIFGVSRRAAHDWGAGKRLSPNNRQQVAKVLSVLRSIDRGSAEANQALLHSPLKDGRTFLDLLCSGEFEEAIRLARKGPGRHVRYSPLPNSDTYNAPSHFGRDLLSSSSLSFDEIRVSPPKLRRAKPRRNLE